MNEHLFESEMVHRCETCGAELAVKENSEAADHPEIRELLLRHYE